VNRVPRGEMTDADIASQIDGKPFEKNLEFVSSLLAIGFVMDVETLASMLGLPTPWARRQLENQSVKKFVEELRQKHMVRSDA
jgi:hypothetical protein